MKRYFFGYLFVRLAKIIAVIVLIGGLTGAAVRCVQGSLEAASIRYEPSAFASSKLFILSQEWDRMRKLIASFMGQSAPTMTEIQFANAPATPADFATIAGQLANIQGDRENVKVAMVRGFEAPVLEIEQKLRAHASHMAAPATSTPLPASEEKSQALDDTGPASPKTLFASLGRSEVSIRRDSLAQSQDFISVLKSSAENPENADLLARALRELTNLERLLPVNLETAPRSPPKNESANSPSPVPKLNAERVADQLQQARRLVRSALLTDWSVDHALAEAVTEVENERKKCIEAGRALQRLWLNVAVVMALTLVASALMSFLILVFADLTQSFLDTATHTAVVASAYQNVGTAEPEAAAEG